MIRERSFAVRARCAVCGAVFPATWPESRHVCDKHDGLLKNEGVLDMEYDYAAVRKNFPAPHGEGMWRYRALLPVSADSAVPPLYVGLTPMYGAAGIAAKCGLKWVGLKDETRNPTHSLADRAYALAAALAKERRFAALAAAVCGAEAVSAAAMSAAMGLRCVLFFPKGAVGHAGLCTRYGARVFIVEGSFAEARELCAKACEAIGWYDASGNAMMAEGLKTAAVEIAESTGWSVPDAVFAGIGSGTAIAALYRGFKDLEEMGVIHSVPKFFGVEPAGCDFLWQAEQDGLTSPRQILAKAAIGVPEWARADASLPPDRVKAMRAVRDSGGRCIRVGNELIGSTADELARAVGILASAEGALPAAGVYEAAKLGLLAGMEWVTVIVGEAPAPAAGCEPSGDVPESLPAGGAGLDMLKKKYGRE